MSEGTSGTTDKLEEIKQRHGLDKEIQSYLATYRHIYVALDVIKSQLDPGIKATTREASKQNASSEGGQQGA